MRPSGDWTPLCTSSISRRSSCSSRRSSGEMPHWAPHSPHARFMSATASEHSRPSIGATGRWTKPAQPSVAVQRSHSVFASGCMSALHRLHSHVKSHEARSSSRRGTTPRTKSWSARYLTVMGSPLRMRRHATRVTTPVPRLAPRLSRCDARARLLPGWYFMAALASHAWFMRAHARKKPRWKQLYRACSATSVTSSRTVVMPAPHTDGPGSASSAPLASAKVAAAASRTDCKTDGGRSERRRGHEPFISLATRSYLARPSAPLARSAMSSFTNAATRDSVVADPPSDSPRVASISTSSCPSANRAVSGAMSSRATAVYPPSKMWIPNAESSPMSPTSRATLATSAAASAVGFVMSISSHRALNASPCSCSARARRNRALSSSVASLVPAAGTPFAQNASMARAAQSEASAHRPTERWALALLLSRSAARDRAAAASSPSRSARASPYRARHPSTSPPANAALPLSLSAVAASTAEPLMVSARRQ
mmetsp:Transcript_5950/g.18787  ORF Transcript_5950/g.18787 Transcript_5950/m.18787 type:complete len:485 (-) Transcript_5950:13-1467(-)